MGYISSGHPIVTRLAPDRLAREPVLAIVARAVISP